MQHGPAASSGSNPKAPGSAGGYLLITDYRDMPKNLLAALTPTCPQCGATGKVKYK